MNYDKFHFSVPRFSGRKTIVFNGTVLIAAQGWLAGAYSGLWSFGPVGEAGLHALTAVALANGVLRIMSDGPVWWCRYQFIGVDLASEPDRTVYHKAADLVAESDFTEYKNRNSFSEYRRAMSLRLAEAQDVSVAEFQRQLDSQLCDARRQLPLDADQVQD